MGRLSRAEEARVASMLRTYHAIVWRTAFRMGLSEAHADDAAQKTFIAACRRIQDIRPGCEKAFLLSTVIFVTRGMRRLASARRESLDEEMVEAVPDSRPGVEELVGLRQARILLARVLEGIPDKQREAFVLFELEGLPLNEIAQLLEVPVGTVNSRLRRAREKFEAGVHTLKQVEGSNE